MRRLREMSKPKENIVSMPKGFTYYVSKNNPIAKSNNHGIIDRNQYVPKYKI